MLNTSHKMRTRPRQSSLHGSLPKRTGSGPNLQSLGQSYLQLPSKSSPKSSPKEGHNIRERVSLCMFVLSILSFFGCAVFLFVTSIANVFVQSIPFHLFISSCSFVLFSHF